MLAELVASERTAGDLSRLKHPRKNYFTFEGAMVQFHCGTILGRVMQS
jgi:hypothetical protein